MIAWSHSVRQKLYDASRSLKWYASTSVSTWFIQLFLFMGSSHLIIASLNTETVTSHLFSRVPWHLTRALSKHSPSILFFGLSHILTSRYTESACLYYGDRSFMPLALTPRYFSHFVQRPSFPWLHLNFLPFNAASADSVCVSAFHHSSDSPIS